MIAFSTQQLQRYGRTILLDEIGVKGQQRIMSGKVLVIGLGGLGSPAAFYLAAAGIGTLGLADGESVDLSNLQRQIIHSMQDIGKPKVESAAAKVRALNPDVAIITHPQRVDSQNIRAIIRQYDFVIDATDTFVAKFLINDACIMEKIPFSHGGVLRFSGQTMTVVPGVSACYRCAFSNPPPRSAVPSTSQAGILGAVPGILGTIQAIEALKFVTKTGESLVNKLLTFDALCMDFRTIDLQKRRNCPLCGSKPTIRELYDVSAACGDTAQ